jgi:hypothetical protein
MVVVDWKWRIWFVLKSQIVVPLIVFEVFKAVLQFVLFEPFGFVIS